MPCIAHSHYWTNYEFDYICFSQRLVACFSFWGCCSEILLFFLSLCLDSFSLFWRFFQIGLLERGHCSIDWWAPHQCRFPMGSEWKTSCVLAFRVCFSYFTIKNNIRKRYIRHNILEFGIIITNKKEKEAIINHRRSSSSGERVFQPSGVVPDIYSINFAFNWQISVYSFLFSIYVSWFSLYLGFCSLGHFVLWVLHCLFIIG